jgi:hypothetical protein
MQKTSLDGQVKAQVVDHVPKRFKELQFGIQYEAMQFYPNDYVKTYGTLGPTKTSSTKQSSSAQTACSTMSKTTEHL